MKGTGRTNARSVRTVRFRLRHLKRVLEIERASFGSEAYSSDMFLELDRRCGDLFFVAERAGRVVGYIVTCVHEAADIVSIAVDPAHRRTGVGSALMRRTLEELGERRVAVVGLMVRAADAGTVRFYRGFGFRRIRRVPRYYEDGGDAFLMRLRL